MIRKMVAVFLLAGLGSCDQQNPQNLWTVDADGFTVFWEEHGLVGSGQRTLKHVQDTLGWEVHRLALKIQTEHGLDANQTVAKAKALKWYLIDDLYYHQEFAGAVVLGYYNMAGPVKEYGVLAGALSRWPWTLHQDPYTDLWVVGVEGTFPYPRLEKVLLDLVTSP